MAEDAYVVGLRKSRDASQLVNLGRAASGAPKCQPRLAHRVVRRGCVPLVGPQEERARGKRRGFNPGAAARHSQYARVYTEFLQKYTFFFHISEFSITHTHTHAQKRVTEKV